jgi:hypothetical protein
VTRGLKKHIKANINHLTTHRHINNPSHPTRQTSNHATIPTRKTLPTNKILIPPIPKSSIPPTHNNSNPTSLLSTTAKESLLVFLLGAPPRI